LPKLIELESKKSPIGGVVENLNIDLVKDIKIPIPPKNIQDEIVAKMDVAYQNKQNKEDATLTKI
jgi:restriction endonuclease S subunit